MVKQFWMLLIVLGGSFGLAFAVTSMFDRGPFERSVVGMEGIYWEVAQQVATSPASAHPLPSPLYPHVISSLASEDLGAVRDARRILTWISLPLLGLLVWLLARPRVGPWMALLAAFTLGITAPIALSAGTLTPAIPATLLALTALLILDRSGRFMVWILAGALIALTGRFHAGLGWGLLILLLTGALLRGEGGSRTQRAGGFGIAFLITLAISGPVLDLAPFLPRIPGADIYRGHRVEASGISARRGDEDPARWWSYLDFLRVASREQGRQLTLAEADRYWTGRALKEAFFNPHRELVRNGVKGLATYAGDPLPRDVSAAFLTEKSEKPGLAISIWLGRILIPLGLVGLLFSRKRTGWPLAVGALSGLLLSWLTFADEDGRLLALSCLAVGVALWLDVILRARTPRRLLVLGISILSVGIWGIAPVIGGAVSGLDVQGDDYFQLGALYDREQRGSAAIREYERSLRLDPDNPYPRLAIAAMLARDNMHVEAIKELELVRERTPEFIPALTALTRAYQQRQMWREASAAHGELVRLEPWNAEHWNNLGTMYVQMALYEQAAAALGRAIEIHPDYRIARENLQALQARGLIRGDPDQVDDQREAQEQILDMIRLGNYPEADRRLTAAYERFGQSATLVFIEGTLRLVSGVPEKAIPLFESVRNTMAGDPVFLNNLGAAYLQTKDYENAGKVYEEGLRIQPANIRLQQGLKAVEAALDSLAEGEG